MGRWTLRHTDEVLVAKIESIINGVIRRSREEADEKAKPLMSYESFVESLDEEDTFTTTLIEILFKELADRRSRPIADRRLISSLTSESLHSLAVTNGVYRTRRFRDRSSTHIHAAPTSLYPPSDSLDEDEDDFGMADGMGAMEGARIDSGLYDVYSGGPAGNPRAYPPAPALTSMARVSDPSTVYRPYEAASIPGRQLPAPHNHFGGPPGPRRWPSVFGPGGSPSTNATPLTRQPNIRRPTSSRIRVAAASTHSASEFAEFAARRRSTQRQLLASRERPDMDGSQTAESSNPRPTDSQPPATTVFYDLPRATLFDPPSPAARDAGTRVSSPSSLDGDETQSGRILRTVQSHPDTLLQNTRDGESTAGPASGGLVANWRTLPPVTGAPRIPPLRLGGIPAPETILPPADSILPPESDSLRDLTMTSLLHPEGDDGGSSFERELRAELDAWSTDDRMLLDRQQEAASVPPRDVQETPASLPTPRSVSPTEETTNASSNANGAAQ